MLCVFCSKIRIVPTKVPTYHTLSLPMLAEVAAASWKGEGGRRAMNKGYHPAVPPARRKALVDARCTLLGTEQASRISVDGDT